MQRQFSHIRFIFLLIIVLNTLDTKDHLHTSLIIHSKKFENDLNYCPKCFENQISPCLKFFQQIQSHNEFTIRQLLTLLPERACKRNNQIVELKNSKEKVIVKYFFKGQKELEPIPQLRARFLRQQEELKGLQLLPLDALNGFQKSLQNFHKNLTEQAIWLYLVNNVQPLVFPLLYSLDFPVPQTYGICGFSFYQQHTGEDLFQFFKSDFFTKLDISLQLLNAALQFSHGFENYRLYITDLTADNIVYDIVRNKLYFIDLDTLFIVDSSRAKYKSLKHKYEYIECPGCFAYSSEDIALYNMSDINIYSACQFLREDLFKDHSKGFLYPIPEALDNSFPQLRQLLNKCVDCLDSICLERFTVAKDLIEVFEKILRDQRDRHIR